MKGRQEVNLELEDDYGEKHKYLVIMHPATSGWPLLLRVVKIVLPALGHSAEGLTMSNIDDGLKKIAEGMDTAMDLRGLGNVGDSVASVASALLSDPSMIKDIFAFSYRDGLPVMEVFDGAYQGNYGELMLALVKVLWANYGPFFKARLGRLLGASRLGSKLSAIQAASSELRGSQG